MCTMKNHMFLCDLPIAFGSVATGPANSTVSEDGADEIENP